MQNCAYCGRENPDNAARCYECGQVFPGKEKPKQHDGFGESLDRPVTSRLKWILWYAAWGVVILAMKPANLLAAPLFPLGLLALFPRGEEVEMILSLFGWLPGIIGWTIYILLAVGIGRTKRTSTFLLMYILFCVLLALNVVGCHRMLEAASQIH